MSIINKVIGKFIPSYRSFKDWSDIYLRIIDTKDVKDKTKANRKARIKNIVKYFENRPIGKIRPHEISEFTNKIKNTNPNLSKRNLIELKEMFNEAINYGWIDRNPAQSIKAPKVKVMRSRLSFEQWKSIYEYSKENQPPWVSIMILLALVTGQRRSDLLKMKYSDIWKEDDGEEYLHIEQQKTGTRIAIPLKLRLNIINLSVEDVIELSKQYHNLHNSDNILRKTNGEMLVAESLSYRFEQAREQSLGLISTEHPPSLHECRSLAERLYREQGINTMKLLGHSKQSMTDLYNNDRGLSAKEQKWKILKV